MKPNLRWHVDLKYAKKKNNKINNNNTAIVKLRKRLDSLLWGEDVRDDMSEQAENGGHNAGNDDCQ